MIAHTLISADMKAHTANSCQNNLIKSLVIISRRSNIYTLMLFA